MGPHDAEARLTVFLTEDDRFGHRSAAEELRERAVEAGFSPPKLWQGSEGFGATGHLRAERLPDLARGLPLLLVLDGPLAGLEAFVGEVHEVAPGSLMTLEMRASPPG